MADIGHLVELKQVGNKIISLGSNELYNITTYTYMSLHVAGPFLHAWKGILIVLLHGLYMTLGSFENKWQINK